MSQLDAETLRFPPESRHQPVRHEMPVEREIHASGNRHADVRLARSDFGRREDFRGHAERFRLLGDARFVFHPLPGPAQHQEPLFDEPEGVVPLRGPLLVNRAPREMQIAQHWCRPLRSPRGRGARHLPGPVEEIAAQSRFYMEGTLGVPHPAQALRDDPGTRERHEMAWHRHAGIGERAAIALGGAALQHDDAMPLLSAGMGDAQAHHPATDDDDARAHPCATMPQQSGSASSKMSVASAVTYALPVMRGSTPPWSALSTAKEASNTVPMTLSCRHV